MMAARKSMAQPASGLSELLAGIATVSVGDDRMISGISMDSRNVQPGDLFLACAGQRLQGHAFIASAISAGAVAVAYEADAVIARSHLPPNVPLIAVSALAQRVGEIAERFYGHPSRDLFMVGVTGTNGKTSCSQFIAQALTGDGVTYGVIGTLGNGLVGQLVPGTHTTPDAVSLHSLLAELRSAGAKGVAMEVSSHALHQGRVNGVEFDVAVFTNLTRDHLDYHGDMTAYGEVKKSLFSWPGLRYAVINADDAFGLEILATLRSDVAAVSYGLSVTAPQLEYRNVPHVCAAAITLHRGGQSLEVISPWGRGRISSSLLGRFNTSNLLAVMATLLIAGMPFAQACKQLETLHAVPGRMECFGGANGWPLVVVDYAHTPDALEHALLALREHCAGRLWCVFGCGGDRDRGKRPLMGAIAERHADRVVLTDDNPRSESAAEIVAEIQAGMSNATAAAVIHDRGRAIAHTVQEAGKQDVVLVAGKGHEIYQQTGAIRVPFSDRDAVSVLVRGERA